MALASITLDPAAQAYADLSELDSVAATKLGGIAEGAEVNPTDTDALPEGTANKYDTGVPPADLEALPDGATRKAMMDAEKTKLDGVEEEAQADQDGAEIRDLIVALEDVERKIVITNPISGEYKVASVEVDADLKLKADYDETPEP